MTVDDPWNPPKSPPPEPPGMVQPSVSNKVGCLLGAGGCFGFVLLFCTSGFMLTAVAERFNKVDQKLDKIEKQMEEKKPSDKKADEKKPDDK
jgi:hypothetical protein